MMMNIWIFNLQLPAAPEGRQGQGTEGPGGTVYIHWENMKRVKYRPWLQTSNSSVPRYYDQYQMGFRTLSSLRCHLGRRIHIVI